VGQPGVAQFQRTDKDPSCLLDAPGPLVPQEVVAEVQLCQEPAAGTEVLYNFDCIWEVTEAVFNCEGLAFPVKLLRAHQICEVVSID
jgi:hypothetical protein